MTPRTPHRRAGALIQMLVVIGILALLGFSVAQAFRVTLVQAPRISMAVDVAARLDHMVQHLRDSLATARSVRLGQPVDTDGRPPELVLAVDDGTLVYRFSGDTLEALHQSTGAKPTRLKSWTLPTGHVTWSLQPHAGHAAVRIDTWVDLQLLPHKEPARKMSGTWLVFVDNPHATGGAP